MKYHFGDFCTQNVTVEREREREESIGRAGRAAGGAVSGEEGARRGSGRRIGLAERKWCEEEEEDRAAGEWQ